MQQASMTLDKEVPTGVEVTIPVEHLRQHEIAPGTGIVYVNDTVESNAALGIAQFGTILVRNNTGETWPAGTELRVEWHAKPSSDTGAPPTDEPSSESRR